MVGVLVNTATVIIGGLIGIICKKGIPKRFTDAIMLGVGLCVLYIGISGTLKGENTLILIVSIVLGVAIGTALKIDARVNSLGNKLGEKLQGRDGSAAAIAQGFVTASLLFCVGSMSVVGSINAGLSGDNDMLFTKSLLDGISAIMFGASLGVGVIFSGVCIFLFQGLIVVLAQFLQPLLTIPSMISEMTCAGSIMIVALGLNLIGVTKIKVADFLPAIIIAPVIAWVATLIS